MEKENDRWRAMLKVQLDHLDTDQKNALAAQVDVDVVTLTRWANGKNSPRSDKAIRDLALALPTLRSALQDAFFDAFVVDPDNQNLLQIPASYLLGFIRSRASTAPSYSFYAISRDVFQSMASQLSSGLEGLMLFFAQCVEPDEHNEITALHVQVPGHGTGIWKRQAIRSFYVSSGSLCGLSVSENRPAFYPEEASFIHNVPLLHSSRVDSAGAFPVPFNGRVAGALFVATTEKHFFTNARRLLIEDYAAAFALSLPDHQFYDPKQIRLKSIPSDAHQLELLQWLRHRVETLQKEYPDKSAYELEDLVMGELNNHD
jgi:hypothetical protein